MARSTWLQGYKAFWVYTLARFALFGVLWLVLWVVGVPSLFAAAIAAVVSIPLSLVLLAKPRQAFAATIESRVSERREQQADLAHRLDPAEDDDEAAAPDVTEPDVRGRSKRR